MCAGGCGRQTCVEHPAHRASLLGSPGQHRSERERTAFLGGFWAKDVPLCPSCREVAGIAAVAALPPVAPLPQDAVERLLVLLGQSYEYPLDAWDRTVREHGGAAAVVRLAAPRLFSCRTQQRFKGRRAGDVLAGVLVACSRTEVKHHLIDHDGEVWTVRPISAGVVRKRRSWAWERKPHDEIVLLLPRILEMVVT